MTLGAKMILRPEQEAAVAVMVAEAELTGAALNNSQLGTGKTVMAVTLAERLNARIVMVVAPLHTKYGWKDTFAQQESDLTFHELNNKDKAGKEAQALLAARAPGIYFVGREWFRLQNWSKVRVDLFVWDESHVLQNRKSAGVKALKTLKRGYTLLQSATPFGSDFTGAWSVARAAWPQHVDGSYWRWVNDYCRLEFDPFSAGGKKVVGELQPGRFFSELPCTVTLEAKNVGEVIHEDVYVDLLPKQRHLYKQMEDDGVAWLGEHPTVADIPIVKRIRLRQLTLGVAAINDEGTVYFEQGAASSKLDALEQILSDLGDEKVLISTDSAKFAKITAARIGGFAWIGEASQEHRELAKAEFIKPDGTLRYIVAHPAAISEGTDKLQFGSHILIILSESDSPVLNQQLVGRLNRSGQTKQVVVIHIRCRGTVDDPQAETLLSKELAMRASVTKTHALAA